MLQHQRPACQGSVSAGPSRQLLLSRPCIRPRSCRAATVAAQAVNRAEFVRLVQQKTEASQRGRIKELNLQEVEEVVKATLDTVVDTVARGDSITLTGFGKFERRDRRARQGRNPKTQESISIPATVTPGFTPGKAFKDTVKAQQK
ncbi:TPA: hypothetical protein ACH3X3_000599 [Trebouxia sp. C0006]